jgi:anaerobic dimethyl sulfoxide reductase subunit C
MDTREWALIIFTILAQMSVGSFIVLGAMHLYAQRKSGMAEADRLADRALLAVVPTLGLGILASFGHLGNPLNGYLAILGFGRSWLSREITFGVVFGALAALFVLMQWFKLSTFRNRNIVAVLGILAGLALIVSMSMAYGLETVPVWNSVFTPISFFTTTALLGVLAMGAALVANYAYMKNKNPNCADAQCTLLRDVLRWVSLAAIVLLGVEFLVVPVQLVTLSASGSAVAAQSITNIAGTYMPVFALRLALVFIGAGVLAAFVYQNAASAGREKVMGNLTYLAFVMVLVSEVLGRFLFYVSFAKIGMF